MNIGMSTTTAHGRRDGLGQHINNLLKNLQKIDQVNNYYIYTRQRDLAEFEVSTPNFQFVPVANSTSSPIFDILWHNSAYLNDMRRRNITVLHLPEYRRIPIIKLFPTVLTIHDMARYYIHDKYDRVRMFYHKVLMPLFFRVGRPDAIIAVSESTRRDVIRFLRVDPEKIVVIHNGAHARFQPVAAVEVDRVRRQYGLPEHFIIYVSRLEHPGKNHSVLLKAFAQVQKTLPHPYKLVFVGGKALGHQKILELITLLDLTDDVILTGFVPDMDLPALYTASDLCVYPSLYEGFGIPVAEAMACGVPVIVADSSSLPEVAGAAGYLVAPRDVERWVVALTEVLTNETLRSRMVTLGFQQARQFTWEKTAKLTLQLYHKVAADAARVTVS